MSNPNSDTPTPEELAQAFHEAYERLAPDYSYKTREASAVPWASVPDNNKQLMIAVAKEVITPLITQIKEAISRRLGDDEDTASHYEEANAGQERNQLRQELRTKFNLEETT